MTFILLAIIGTEFKPLSDEEIQYFEEQEMKKMQQNRLVKLEDALQVESFKEKLATSVVTIEQQQQLEQQPAFALVAAPKLQTVHPAEVDLSHLVIVCVHHWEFSISFLFCKQKKKKKKTMKKSEVGKKRTREEGQGTAKQKETPEDQISAPTPPAKSQPAQLLKDKSPPIGTAKPQLKNTEQELQHKKKKQKQKQPNVEKNPLYSLLTTSYDSD